MEFVDWKGEMPVYLVQAARPHRECERVLQDRPLLPQYEVWTHHGFTLGIDSKMLYLSPFRHSTELTVFNGTT